MFFYFKILLSSGCFKGCFMWIGFVNLTTKRITDFWGNINKIIVKRWRDCLLVILKMSTVLAASLSSWLAFSGKQELSFSEHNIVHAISHELGKYKCTSFNIYRLQIVPEVNIKKKFYSSSYNKTLYHY